MGLRSPFDSDHPRHAPSFPSSITPISLLFFAAEPLGRDREKTVVVIYISKAGPRYCLRGEYVHAFVRRLAYQRGRQTYHITGRERVRRFYPRSP